MQTHEDSDARRFVDRLEKRAEEAKQRGDGQITAGMQGEPILAKWDANGVQVVVRPDDPQGILRISIGGGHDLPVNLNYCTIRGDVGKCISLLEKAIAALRACPE